jgi:hypothetical protein
MFLTNMLLLVLGLLETGARALSAQQTGTGGGGTSMGGKAEQQPMI